MNGIRRLALFAAFWMLGTATASGAAAQVDTGAIVGVLRSDGDSAPIPLSLVQLLSTDSTAAAIRSVLTDDEGRFRFDHVPTGVYRLRVARVGYVPVSSAPLQLRSRETLQHDLVSAMAPVQLAELRVGPSRCLRGDQLAEVAEVATLWSEARKGSEARSAFLQQYSFVLIRHYVTQSRNLFGRKRTTSRADTVLSTPDSFPVWETRRQRRLAKGYGSRQGPVLHTVSEVDILNDKFLETHCVEGAVEEGDGVLGLHFRPVQTRRGFVDIRGIVWVDSDNFLLRGLDFEWVDNDGPFAGYSYTYEDVAVDGGVFRLLKRGELTGRGGLDLRIDATVTSEQIRRVVP